MAKTVIHLFGASGSGTTTFGRYIAEKTGGFFMDTDDYFWAPTDPPYTTKRDVSERLELMRKDIDDHDIVVISGSLVDWGDPLIPLFTLAIRVVTETSVRIERLRKREREKLGSRIDKGGDMYDNHQEFLAWAASYDEGSVNMRSRAKHDVWQKRLSCPVVTVNGNEALGSNYGLIKEYIGA
ncbi:MAG: shikimate kinase [Clostridiales bacterium]|nr:shikimate kinase [Clostridiales bacterium]